MQYWKLVDGVAVPCDMAEWAAHFETTDRIIKQSYAVVRGTELLVSTVFIGYGPLPFESMLFVRGRGDEQVQAATVAEALEHHQMAVDKIEAAFPVRLTVQKSLSHD